jgi:hypothetical protein
MIVLPKTSSEGIQVDPAAATFPWHGITGMALFNTAGANAPTIAAYRGGNGRLLKFIANDRMDYVFHIPHDYAPGTDIHAHVHWLHNGTAISGNASFRLDYSYAKGHNQANFPAEKQQTITYATTNIATTPQYRHRIDEIVISDATGSGNYLDRTTFEVDGIITMGLALTSLPTITGGDLFIFTADLHYQSTGIGTKQKAPNFYV